MKILILGDWNWVQYERSFASALIDLGNEVIPFQISDYYHGFLAAKQKAVPVPSPTMFRMNRELLLLVKKENPDMFLAWRSVHLLPTTIREINKLGVITVSYNNDDPFGPRTHGNVPWHHHFLWFWYLRGLKHYKCNFFYRQVNIAEALKAGAVHANVLKSYFIPWQDKPVRLSKDERQRFGCDVVFVGNYEPDDRVGHLKALVHSGLSTKLFGKNWTSKVLDGLYSYFAPIVPVEGDDYPKALCGAKVCLAFLSKLNRDTYTRRCFEIPACGRVMLAERTEDLLSMFEENKEACFFSSSDELVAKAKWLVKNPGIAESIAMGGLRRVWADGHDVKSRVAEFIAKIQMNNRCDEK